MYSSYSAAAFALKAVKPSYNTHSSYFPSHHCHHFDGDSYQRKLLPVNPHLSPRSLLDGYLLRHSTHLLLLSARLRHSPPPHPPHCCRRREAACCYSRIGSGCGRPVLGHVSWRLETSWHRCCGQGSGRSDLGLVCPQLKARGCGCGGSGRGKLYLGNCFGRRDAPRLLGRALQQELWEYEGGEWTHRRFSMECHGDCGEEEGDECGLAQLEVPVRLHLRRWEEEDCDRCRDCRRKKCAESDYQDDGEYYGQWRERRDVNGIHCRFQDPDWRRLDQRGCNDNEDDINMKRRREMMEGRDRRDFEFDDAVATRRFGAGRYCEDDRKYDQRRERQEFESEDLFDARREGDGRYAEDDRRFDRRTERMDFEIDDENYVRREGRHHSNDDKRFLMQNSRIRQDREENVSLLGSCHWHGKECDDDYQDNLDQKYYSWRRTQRSALREDDSEKALTSRNIVDPRFATKGKNAASRVWWHDNVDRRAGQTSKERDCRYSSSVGWSNNENDYNDAWLVKVRDFRTGVQDVKVIIEDDTSLASSSKNTSILKHHSNIDHQLSARKQDSKKSSERIMDMSEVRHNNTELDSTTQSDHQEDGRKCIYNKSSSLQSSVKMANHSTRQIDQHDKVDQQVAGLTDTRTNSEKLTDITIDSTHNVSRASLSQRNYDEVNQMDIDDRSSSIENITHIVRDKKRYVNQQVIHESETDIDVQNVTNVDVSKVCASDVSMSRSSQDHSKTRSDVNSISKESLIDSARGQQEQIHQSMAMVSESAMVKCPHSNLGTGVYGRVHSASVTNVVGCTKEMKEQVELPKAHDTATMASTSKSHIRTRVDDQFQSSSPVNTAGSLNAQIDLIAAVSSSHNSSNNQAHRTLAINLVGKARDSRDKSGQQMKQGSSIERNDQVRTKISQSFDESREGLTRAEETRRLMQHNMALNWPEAGTSKISDDKDITSLEMVSSEEASIVDAVVEQRGVLFGRSETTAGRSIPGGITTRKSVNESLLESAARLEKPSTFHAGQFVAELQKGVSNAYTTLTKKDEKSIMEDFTTPSSRSRMKGPSDEMWDVQSATSLETFKTADKEEGFSADGGTNSASQTPKNETALARKVHKSFWAYVGDIVHLGWIQRGEFHDSSNKSVKKSSSSNTQSTEGWLSTQGHDSDDIQKKGGSAKPKDGQLMTSHGGESESRLASMPQDESFPTGTKSLQISEASNVPKVGRSKGDFVARVSKNDVLISGERAKLSEADASPKGNFIKGLVEDSTATLIDVSTRHSPEHDAATSSRIVTKGSAEINTGKGAEEAGWNVDAGNWRYRHSVAITPYNHPQSRAMMPHENASSSFLKSPELPAGGSMRSEEKNVVQEAPEVIRTDRKDAELNRRKIQRNKQVLKETFDEWEEAYQHDAKQRKTDEFFMKEALLEAQRGADMWEVPVGAVLVHNGEIIARGCNLVEDLRDSTAHAEIVCIREASNKLKTWRLADATLYVTLEPCAMCAGAILQARVDTVVWGAPNKLLGADGSWVRLFPSDGQTSTLYPENQNLTSGPVHPFHPKIIVRRGVLPMECSEIMQQFFQLRRKKQKPESPPLVRLPGHHHHPIKFFTKMHHMFGSIFCL